MDTNKDSNEELSARELNAWSLLAQSVSILSDINTNKDSNKELSERELNERALLSKAVELLSDIKTDIADIQYRIANNLISEDEWEEESE